MTPQTGNTMKKLLVGGFAALASATALATTFSPVQLLDPTGSTAGQAIISTGASSFPAWGNISATALTGIVPALSGGTGVTTAAAELARIGGAKSGANTDITSLAAPALGAATATTAANGTNTTQVATTQFVLSNAVTSSSPTITTPNIIGVTNGSSAAAGSVGQTFTGGTTAPIASSTSTSVGSLNLTAGNWLVWATGIYLCTGGNVISAVYMGVSTTLNNLGATGNYTQIVGTSLGAPSMATPLVPMRVTTTTPVYATGNIGFTSGTCTLQTVMNALRFQ
jgi:hypothetical protein